ncbi:jg6727 [Pararge aegeria aegeria]|uniref:Jg6727 protein n=1 Tax=Pararge aegeria aegeria TaxID=348720 RepID=A0A8S4SIB3_9NEOP|nr:jg6727 [Pararge aegeria aegeria]
MPRIAVSHTGEIVAPEQLRYSFCLSDVVMSGGLSYGLHHLLLLLGLSPYLVGLNRPLYVWPLIRLPAGSLQPAELTPEA